MADEVHGQRGSRLTESGICPEVDNICEPCLAGHNKKPSFGWCETCDELLCEDCYQVHLRPKLMRNHQLKSLEDMKARKKLKRVVTNCDTHEGESLRYYCEDHRETGCSDCLVDKHHQCGTIVKLSAVKVSDSAELKDTEQDLLNIEQKLTKNMESVEKNIDLAKNQCEITIACIKENEKQLKLLIEKLAKEKIETAKKMRDNDLKKMQEHRVSLAIWSASVATGKELLEFCTNDEKEPELFITVKKVQVDIEQIKGRMQEADRENSLPALKFILNKSLAKLLTEMEELGSFESVEEQLTEPVTMIQQIPQSHIGHKGHDEIDPVTAEPVIESAPQQPSLRTNSYKGYGGYDRPCAVTVGPAIESVPQQPSLRTYSYKGYGGYDRPGAVTVGPAIESVPQQPSPRTYSYKDYGGYDRPCAVTVGPAIESVPQQPSPRTQSYKGYGGYDRPGAVTVGPAIESAPQQPSPRTNSYKGYGGYDRSSLVTAEPVIESVSQQPSLWTHSFIGYGGNESKNKTKGKHKKKKGK